jgi:hypothetical protein
MNEFNIFKRDVGQITSGTILSSDLGVGVRGKKNSMTADLQAV